MFSAAVTILNKSGLHARPAALLARECKGYESVIELVSRDGERIVNCKSVISLLSGGFRQGETAELRVTGEDEQEAGPALLRFIEELEG